MFARAVAIAVLLVITAAGVFWFSSSQQSQSTRSKLSHTNALPPAIQIEGEP